MEKKCLNQEVSLQEPENWLWYTCLFINNIGICMVNPTEKLFIYYYSPLNFIRLVLIVKVAIQHWRGEEAAKLRVPSSLLPFLYKQIQNGCNLAILAPINLRSIPFYWSHASDSDGIKICHVQQNGHQLWLLQNNERRLPISMLCIKWVLIYTKRFLYQKKAYFISFLLMYSKDP